MLLTKLLEGITWEGEAPECEIVGLTADSRQLEPGWVYVCQKGQRFDGHDFAEKALELGAAAVVVDRDLGLPRQIRVEDTHAAYPLLCANFFLIKHLLTAAGHRTGLIGTVQNEIGDLVLPAKFTTPDPYQLQSMLAKMRAAGCEYVAMEVSSHALDQHRADGIHFDVAVFTNLTLDHLDYHHTMEEYFDAKRKLFDRCDTAVLNIDDEHGRILAKELSCRTVTISDKDDTADYLAGNIRIRSDGSSFVVLHGGELEKVNISTPGDFSIHNALGALAAVTEAGVPMAQAAADLADCAGVPGRFEVVPNALGFTVIRDYAHTPDGIDNVLSTVRGITNDRMVVLFGCPGLRDSSKRPAMAAAVAKYADFVILTSDNPREEPEEKIIKDALPGLTASGKPYKIISDRYEAIEYALETCGEGDILLLLGKGHEDYQVLASGANYFNEKEIVGELSRKIARQRTGGSEK